MHLRNRIPIGAIVLAALFARTAAAADCPTNFGVVPCSTFQSTAPVFSYNSGFNCFPIGTVGYNLLAGTIHASVSTLDHISAQSMMQTSDVFVISGPSSATPIGFQAIFTTVRQTRTRGRLTVGAVTIETSAPGSGTEVLKLNAAFLPGQPFTVGMFVEATAFKFDPNQISGSLVFSTLPPGYSLTSCQGYATAPVGIRVTSWGRLKQIYR